MYTLSAILQHVINLQNSSQDAVMTSSLQMPLRRFDKFLRITAVHVDC